MRQEAVEATLERNPNAFRPKIAPSPGAEEETKGVGRHNKVVFLHGSFHVFSFLLRSCSRTTLFLVGNSEVT